MLLSADLVDVVLVDFLYEGDFRVVVDVEVSVVGFLTLKDCGFFKFVLVDDDDESLLAVVLVAVLSALRALEELVRLTTFLKEGAFLRVVAADFLVPVEVVVVVVDEPFFSLPLSATEEAAAATFLPEEATR